MARNDKAKPGPLCTICGKRRTFDVMPDGEPICHMCKSAIFNELVKNVLLVKPTCETVKVTTCQDRIILEKV